MNYNRRMSQIQTVKEATSIVEIIGERIALTQVGNRYKGLCPFHGEKTPSFMVTEELGMYKCFGCGEGGDVFTFLEKYDGMTFAEALEYLADRAGIVLEKKNQLSTQQEDEKKLLLSALSMAADFYEAQLADMKIGKIGQEYLKKRAVTADSRKLFRIGYASDQWSALTDFLIQKKKFSPKILISAGLTIKSQKGSYFDRFRSRLMFPLKNHRGQIVGFSGRWLGAENDREGKYINTPETEVYHKSQLFYGLAENVLTIKKEKSIVVVEGEFDMISSCQAHVRNCVAIKGSAFTTDHAHLIKRYVKQVILALDADAAGVEATRRAASVLTAEGVALRVVVIPSGKDPDELARRDPQAWRETVDHSLSVYDYLINALSKKYDLATIEGKKDFLEDLAPSLGTIKQAVEADYYLQKIARLLDVRADLVATDLRNLIKKSRLMKKNISGSKTINDFRSLSSASSKIDHNSQTLLLEKYFLFLLFSAKAETFKIAVEKLRELDPPLEFEDKIVKELVRRIFDFKLEFSLENFSRFLPDDLASVVSEIYLDPHFVNGFEANKWSQEYQKTLASLRRGCLQKRLQSINSQLELLDQQNDKTAQQEQKEAELLREIVTLQRQMK